MQAEPDVRGAAVAVSVILPVHNGACYVSEALESVLAQRQPADWPGVNLEVLVVDDGSSDTSPGIIAEYARRDARVRTIRQQNAGVTVARNAGIAAARGEFLMFIDQDDRYTEVALQAHLAAFARDPTLGYTVAHQTCFLHELSEPPAWFGLQQLDTPVPGYLPGTLCVRRELFALLGVFDERYPVSSDADWFARARDAAVPMRLLDEVTLQRRIHSVNQSRHSGFIHSELLQLLGESIRRKREDA